MLNFSGWLPLTAVVFSASAFALDHAPNFRLIDQDDRVFELYRWDTAERIAITAFDAADTGCRESLKLLRGKQRSLERAGTRLLLVQVGAGTDRTTLRELRQTYKIKAPIVTDTALSVSRALGLRHVGDTLLVAAKDGWRILGCMRWEDFLQHGIPNGFRASDVKASNGAPLAMVQAADLSYSRDIAPILQSRCLPCHREGGIGPFAMSSHKKVRGWAAMMQEVILTRRMPPWHADPNHGKFKNDLALTTQEEAALMAWLANDAPIAAMEDDPLATAHEEAQSEWALGTPDLVVRMPEAIALPATGVIEYKYVYVPSGLTENKWVRGVEVRAGNSRVVHHALVFAIYPREYEHVQPKTERGLGGFFASFLPGSKIRPFPEGTAQFLPAGTIFVFQMHYNATGKPESDQSEMGLYFADAPPRESLQVTAVATTDFRIKPQLADQPVAVAQRIEQPQRLWGVLPHMHYRGQSFRYFLTQSGKEPETLLNVPWYQFDWQPMYYFDVPIELPAGATLRCEGSFDNSKYNALNPDPKQTVTFGEQSFDEMFIGYLLTSSPLDANQFLPKPVTKGNAAAITPENMSNTEWDANVGRNLVFKPKGVLKLAFYTGTWRIDGQSIVMELAGETFTADIVGSDLFFAGERMIRVK